jgi:diacylglycerol kinase (ATP)
MDLSHQHRPRRLAVLVNDRSGGQAGLGVAARLRERLGPDRVASLGSTTPMAFVEQNHGSNTTLIAAGGDGTAAAVLEASHQFAQAHGCEACPVGILPLGTGNDLASTLGWPVGAGHVGRIDWCVNELQKGSWGHLDRFTVTGPGLSEPWYNYCSWGCDARVARHFHAMREHSPALFRVRTVNRLYYAILGLVDRGAPLAAAINGISAPAWAHALVCSNIPYYAGGGSLGPQVVADDGLSETFALGPGLLLGLATRGLRRPRCLAQGGTVTVTLRRSMPMQLDGEPLNAAPGRYHLAHGGQVPVALYPSARLAVCSSLVLEVP